MTRTSPANSTNSQPLRGAVWGIDIGGANVKLFAADGQCVAAPCALWLEPERLNSTIRQLMATSMQPWSNQSIMAVTMTGELADCFASRREGVYRILDCLSAVVPAPQCRIYAVGGQWYSIQQACSQPWDVAASNWHALAAWCLQESAWGSDEWSTIVDIGSTTVDIIPLAHRQIATAARTDRQRMQLGQLVYTGMQRTPIHAIVGQLDIEGRSCPVMAERFATIDDVNLILGAAQQDSNDCDTADGRPRTRTYALARLARMVGEDTETLAEPTIVSLATQIAAAQARQVGQALIRNLSTTELGSNSQLPFDAPVRPQVLVSGHGRPLIERLKNMTELEPVRFVYLDQFVSPAAARCAPALAVAALWKQHQCSL
ncbi:MAG: hypothetical protein KF752_13805 [Pirellulaceae bacterium]|nr:hypothetical protein [Pirellulaceae bacterium]